MSITKNPGTAELVTKCDVCSKTFNTKESNFKRATVAMRKNGWYSRQREQKDWVHLCGRDCLHSAEKQYRV